MFQRIALAAAAAVAFAGVAVAQPAPQPAPAARKHSYDITPESGAWCICVQSFFENFEAPAGRDFYPQELEQLLNQSKARRQSIDFVSCLRRDYKLPAYMFNRGDDERKKEEERVEAERKQREELYRKMGAELPPKLYRKRLMHIQDQYMVLIGGYPDQDTARHDLDHIRKLNAPPQEFMNRIQAALEVHDKRQATESGYLNPFATAMVVPNPTGPKLARPTVDQDELAKGLSIMNANNPYNLLKHQGKWTLVVKMYRVPGNVVGSDGKNKMVGPDGKISAVAQAQGMSVEKMYEAIAKQAEQLASILHSPQLNFDAYVLHTHNSSLVTVGVFDSEKDPRLAPLQARLATLRLDPEQLISPPMPMPVPKAK
jgi:hypothetical protein